MHPARCGTDAARASSAVAAPAGRSAMAQVARARACGPRSRPEGEVRTAGPDLSTETTSGTDAWHGGTRWDAVSHRTLRQPARLTPGSAVRKDRESDETLRASCPGHVPDARCRTHRTPGRATRVVMRWVVLEWVTRGSGACQGKTMCMHRER